MRVEDLPIPKPPFIKSKGFCPNPLVKHGIPHYADISVNPRCEGTPEYEKFWEEQLYRCIHGYQTGGWWIPGRFYYYMNFNQMATPQGIITPDFCDMHLELAYIIEWCKANRKNLIIGKKRRAGISEFTQKAVVDHGYRFKEAYRAGVAAGLKAYAEDFMDKWASADSLMQPEFRIGTLLNNNDEVVSGYKITEEGKEIIKGLKTQIYVRTMHSNPNLFKGLYLHDIIAEECGEFENLLEFYSASKDCLTDGDLQIGTFFFYGTGGNVTKGSKDFMKVWNDPDKYNFVKYLITGDRFCKPYYGGATRYGEDIGQTPNLSKLYKPYQLIGCEDREAAMKHIMTERERLKKGDLKPYLEHLQNNPINEAEIFMKMFSNNFDIQRINEQLTALSIEKRKYSKYKLEWLMKDDNTLASPLQVKPVPLKDGEDESECVYILDEFLFLDCKKYQNLVVAGLDAYDQDKAVSNSLGGMCVITRKNTYGIPFHMPIAVIRTRPARKEKFFDMCMKLSVYYNLIGNTLGDKAGSSGIINWYKQHGCEKYLAKRPTKFESENSEQSHEYWMSINSYSKPLMLGLMQTAIYDYVQNIHFDLLINELASYDEKDADSDKDLADAYGIALVQDASVGTAPRDNSFMDKDDPFSLNDITKEQIKRISIEQDYDGFGS